MACRFERRNARDRHLAVDGTWLPVLVLAWSSTAASIPCRSWRPHGDDQGRATTKRVGWIVILAAALSSGAAWSQERFAALQPQDSSSFTLPPDHSPEEEPAHPPEQYASAMQP